MTRFKQLYMANKETLKLLKMPKIQAKVKRVCEASVDSLELVLIDLDEEIEKLYQGLAEGNMELLKDLLEKELEKDEIVKQVEMLRRIEEYIFADVPEVTVPKE
jgi:UTP-glucose-1-phosphate uridylyltransferase